MRFIKNNERGRMRCRDETKFNSKELERDLRIEMKWLVNVPFNFK